LYTDKLTNHIIRPLKADMKTQPDYAKSVEGRIRKHENVEESFKAIDKAVTP
jgi:hypothetical protein